MTVQLQTATQYHYYRTVVAIFPLAPDQTIPQMWSILVQRKTYQQAKLYQNPTATVQVIMQTKQGRTPS